MYTSTSHPYGSIAVFQQYLTDLPMRTSSSFFMELSVLVHTITRCTIPFYGKMVWGLVVVFKTLISWLNNKMMWRIHFLSIGNNTISGIEALKRAGTFVVWAVFFSHWFIGLGDASLPKNVRLLVRSKCWSLLSTMFKPLVKYIVSNCSYSTLI